MPRVESISVSDPEIVSSPLRSYATYKITSKVFYDMNGVENAREGSIIVRRRFREFVLLQESLRANNPGLHPSKELVESRTILLQRYLNNLLAHRSFQTDPSFWLFIESENFPQVVQEFKLRAQNEELKPPTRILHENPRHADPLEDRLDYLVKIAARLEILKYAFAEFFSAQKNLAERIAETGKSLTGYLDAATDGGNHSKLIHLIDSMSNISDLLAVGTDQMNDAGSFSIIVEDYIRLMQEIEQAFNTKRMWRTAIYNLEIRIIDTQASLIKSQNDQRRNFDKNYRLSESFLQMREELKETSKIYDTICQRLNSELDRIDSRRMLEIEEGINHLLHNLLEAQSEGFIAANESDITLAAASSAGIAFYM